MSVFHIYIYMPQASHKHTDDLEDVGTSESHGWMMGVEIGIIRGMRGMMIEADMQFITMRL